MAAPPYKGDLEYRGCRHLAQLHSWCYRARSWASGPPDCWSSFIAEGDTEREEDGSLSEEEWGSGRRRGFSGKEVFVPRGRC